MAAKKKWSDLSTRVRKLIIVGAVFEGSLKTAALIDIKRRPASQYWSTPSGAHHSHTSSSGGDGNQGPSLTDMAA